MLLLRRSLRHSYAAVTTLLGAICLLRSRKSIFVWVGGLGNGDLWWWQGYQSWPSSFRLHRLGKRYRSMRNRYIFDLRTGMIERG